MKQRTAFVANSSSSSFIVVYRDLTYEERDSIFDEGIIPEHLTNKVECMTGRCLSEADDVVYINEKTLPVIIEHGLAQKFRYSAIVVETYADEDDFVIKPEHVGKQLQRVEKDYCATNDDAEKLLMRYDR